MDPLRAWRVSLVSVKVLKLPMSKTSWRRASRISHRLRTWAAFGAPPTPRKVTLYSLERLSPRTMSWPAGELGEERRAAAGRGVTGHFVGRKISGGLLLSAGLEG